MSRCRNDDARIALGRKSAEFLREVRRQNGIADRNEHGIVAADRADDFGQGRLVERDPDEMRRAGRRLEHDQIAGEVDRADPVAEHGRELRGPAHRSASWSGSA